MCGVLCVLWLHEGVVLCDELCVVLFGVLRGGGVVCTTPVTITGGTHV